MTQRKVLRAYQLSQSSIERFQADLEAANTDFIGDLIATLLEKACLNRIKAWNEMARIAELNEETETLRLSFITNQILVLPKGEGDE
jgi:hypothetical protein